MRLKFKPNLWTFLVIPLVLRYFIYIFFLAFFGLLINIFLQNIFFISILLCGGIVFLFFLYNLIDRIIAYKKELYLLEDGFLTKKAGNIFSDFTSVLELKKIISITICRPFIANLLFNTESLYIDSAGTQNIYISLNDLDDSSLRASLKDEVFANLSIYPESKEPILLKPSYFGAIATASNASLSIVYSIGIYIFYLVIDAIFLSRQVFSSGIGILSNIIIIYLIFGIISSVWSFIISFFRIYFTSYFFFDKYIHIKFGVFTKSNFYLHDSNFTDLITTRSFIEKLLGIKSVTISAPNNPSIANISQIPNTFDISLIKETRKNNLNIPTGNNISLRPNPLRFSVDIFLEVFFITIGVVLGLLHPPLLILLLPSVSFVFYIFIQATQVFFTKYQIANEFVKRDYNFLNSKSNILSSQNITSVKITQNFIDKLLGTGSIAFYSLGASESVKISYIDLNDKLLQVIESYFEQSEYRSLTPEIDFKNWSLSIVLRSPKLVVALIFAIFYYFIFMANASITALMSFGVIFALVIGFILSDSYLSYRNVILMYNDYNIEHIYGWWNRTRQILKQSFVKDISTIQYPAGGKGEIIINIAGDLSDAGGTNLFDFIGHFLKSSISNQINIKFINLDNNLISRINSNYYFDINEVKSVFRPEKSNTLFKGLVLLLLPLLLPYLIYIYFKLDKTSFEIYSKALISSTGVFYKSKTYLLRSNIDYVDLNQDFLNKFLNNGSINIFSSGSSLIEISIFDIEEYKEVFEILKK